MIGKVFFNWTVKEKQKNKKQRAYGYICKCKCGKEQWIRTDHFLKGKSKQCRICSNQIKAEKKVIHGYARRNKNGITRSNTYNTWALMHRRCTKEYDPEYKNYGGRGITVCERWNSFSNFLKDMGEAPKGYYIDRIDFNGNYNSNNCRWITPKESALNTRRCEYYLIDGIKMVQKEVCRVIGVSETTLIKYKKIYGKEEAVKLLRIGKKVNR